MIPVTENDLRNYAYNANQEMKKLRRLPRQDRIHQKCIYVQVDNCGHMYWSSLMIGGNLRI